MLQQMLCPEMPQSGRPSTKIRLCSQVAVSLQKYRTQSVPPLQKTSTSPSLTSYLQQELERRELRIKDAQRGNIRIFLCSAMDKEVLGRQRSPSSFPTVTLGDAFSGSEENKNGAVTSVKTNRSPRGLTDHDTGSLTKVVTLKIKSSSAISALAFLLSLMHS